MTSILSFLKKALLTASFLSSFHVFATVHVIDISTGIDNNGLTPIYTTPDDDWTVKLPPPATSFIPVYCGTGTPLGYSTYIGKDPNVRWVVPKGHPLAPYLLPSGEHNDGPVGVYEYRMTFDFNPCEVQSITFNLDHIGGDNNIFEILLNGTSFPVNYGWNPFTNGATINASSASLLSGTNEIIVKLNNTEKYFGLEINGNLTIVDNSPSLSLGISYNNGVLSGSSNDVGNHFWEVFCAPNATTGPYSLVASFNTTSFTFSGNCGCYYVRHNFDNACGNICTAQTICEADCELDECSVSAPTGLQVTHLSSFQSQFTWNPVWGAVSYVLEISPNDPACCGGNQMFITAPFVFPVASNSEIIDFSQILWPWGNGGTGGETSVRCFSWRVRAVCANGSMSNYSQSMCSNPGSGEPWLRPAKTGSSMTEDSGNEMLQGTDGNIGGFNAAEAVIFPNPAKESVEINVRGLQSETINIQILDATGKVVKTIKNLRTENGQISKQLNVESFDKGTYLIQISSDGNTVMTERLVVE